jgi:hypothetical protein
MGRTEQWLGGLRRRLQEMRRHPRASAPDRQPPGVPQPPSKQSKQPQSAQQQPGFRQRTNKLAPGSYQGVKPGSGSFRPEAAHKVVGFELIPDETEGPIPGAASERQQLEIETHRRRVLRDRTPEKTIHKQDRVRESLCRQHPIQSLGDNTIEQLQKHVQPYIDSD